MNTRLYEMHAAVCAALANAKRVHIIDLLQDGEKAAGVLAEEMGISSANLSQHLQVMKAKGLVLMRREGVNIYYRLANDKIVSACELMREVLMDQLEDLSRLREGYTSV